MKSRILWPTALLIAVAICLFGMPAHAAIVPESDVLLPWFEVDLERQDLGLATNLSLVNASADSVRVRVTVYTNWGIPVLEVPLLFDRAEAKTINLHEWIAHGRIPGRTLTEGELAVLQAQLTGKPSPADGLYYSTSFQPGRAVGYVIAQTLDQRPDVLWGDTYSVDGGENYFEAETLTALTHGLKADCNRHGIRYVNEGQLYDGAELIIWSGRRFQPSASPTPVGPKMKVTIGVYDQAGHHVQDCYRELLAVDSIMVCHLDITPPVGWLDVRTEDESFILQHLHSTTQASAELHSYCLRADLRLEGASIRLEKRVAGDDADRPPGPRVPIGDTVEYEYEVTNSGTTPLTAVSVTDDAGLTVTCPQTSLAPGESMSCTASTIVNGCLLVNVGTATGTAPDGTRVTATDIANVSGTYNGELTIELLVNDDPADQMPGPSVEAGSTLQWTFVVTNSGNAKLTGIEVEMDRETITCPKVELEPGESMNCSAQTLASEGQRHEVATVTGLDPCMNTVVASDPAYYFGRRQAPAITIEKYAGESEADTPPGPAVPAGSTVQWRFLVTNTGNVPLHDIVVTDVDGPTPTCPKNNLQPGESMICTASSIALPCQQSNTATVTAAGGGTTVTASDPAFYYGQGHPALALELGIEGERGDEPPGPWIDEGATMALMYVVTNTGDVTLSDITVNDDRDVTATCPQTTLAPGASMVCTAASVALAGTRELTGVATGKPPCGDPVQATDPFHYRGRTPVASIDIVKMTNGIHVTAPPGPSVAIASVVNWSYVVTNTGTVPLDVTVTDGEVAVTCPNTTLQPAESMTCTASGLAQACQYSNTATATGLPIASSVGSAVTASDDSYYFGQHSAAIALDKKMNGEDAPQAPGPPVTTGTTLQWTFLVTNSGDVALTSVAVTDDSAGAVTCPKTSLAVGESMTCTASSTALSGPQRNTASATGKPPCGNDVSATDSSHYRGVTPSIRLEKLINGFDADDSAHAVPILIGAPVLWSFVVTNTGDVALSEIAVTDDRITAITCPATTLAAGASMTCTASGFATEGLDCDHAVAVGTSPQQVRVESADSACYTGLTASISIEKSTNGAEADTPPGPDINVGLNVYWTYVVTNTGAVELTGVSVTDNRGVTVTCPKTTLAPAESMTCTASGIATAGQYSNIGTASGTPAGGSPVSASDPSHYYGREVVENQGCTPGYWKNHTGSWAAAGYSPTQSIGTVFAMASLYNFQSIALVDGLAFGGGPDNSGAAEILLRAAIAALLNASHPGVAYPRQPFDVVTDTNAALASQNRDAMLALAAALDADNNRGCPLN